jgi:diacylglycerol kinase family enzyme
MSFPVSAPLDRPFARRTAFLLNANARAVSPRLVEELAEIVPAGDLFLSRTFEDAQVFARTIVRRGYGQVFLGGGDGTLVTTMNLLRQIAKKEGLTMPALGVLKLGTGNAMARALAAKNALVDAHHAIQKGPQATQPVHFVETDDGELTPFAGMGYDGIVLNDYVWLKKKAHASPLAKKAVESVWGYLGAMLFKSVPSQLSAALPNVKITSNHDAILMVKTEAGDVEQVLPAGTVLYEGKAPIMSIGSIPFFGYGFTMFPFAGRKPGYAQLRVGNIPIPVILANLYPRIWNGSFRHPTLTDVLVKDVVIESDRAVPYQVGGDARGEKKRITYAVSEQPVQMIELGERLVPQGTTVFQLGPARLMLRLPR